MKHTSLIFYILFYCWTSVTSFAQQNLDSLSFESQRKRVNDLLDQRNKRFGDYTTSLEQKTGIFGLFKTKNDMQKSIDILKSIVINDNAIFMETRKLLDLKDSQAERFQKLATEYDQRVTAYMKTISKLQSENEQLRNQIKTWQDEDHNDNKYRYIGFVLLLVSGIIFISYKRRRSKNVTKV